MTKRDLIRMVLENLGRMKFRAILTTLGVIIGTGAIVTMISLGAGLQRQMIQTLQSDMGTASQLTVYRPGNDFFGGPSMPSPAKQTSKRHKVKLDNKAVVEIMAINGVEQVMPQVISQVEKISFRRYATMGGQIIGAKSHLIKEFGFKINKGKWYGRSTDIVVGAAVPKNFFFTKSFKRIGKQHILGEKVSLSLISQTVMGGPGAASNSSTGKKIDVRVVGILKQKDMQTDSSVFMSLKFLQKLKRKMGGGKRNKEYSNLLIKLSTPQAIKKVEKQIKKLGFETGSMRDVLKGISTVFVILQAVLGAIGAIALIVASLGIVNTMTMTIYERTREIGIMKAIGASRKNIMQIFLTESATIGFGGGLIGTLLGIGGSQFINIMLLIYFSNTGQGMKGGLLYTPPWLIVFAITFATIIGFIAGIYPALRASRLSPLLALRHE